MNVLITNIHLSESHGSEIWTLAIAREFKRRGDHVYIYSPKLGPFWGLYLAHEFSTLRKPEDCLGLRFDIAIIQHANQLRDLDFFQRYIAPTIVGQSEIILVTHGTYVEPEMPIGKDCINNAIYVCISEEIARHYSDFDWNIIRQPIDPEWFEIPESNQFNTVCWASHRWPVPHSLELACDLNGKELLVIGNKPILPEEVREVYHESDLIIGTGRWIYEAMAAGRPCVVADSNYTLGYLNEATVKSYQCYNMTTRQPATRIFDGNNIGTGYEYRDGWSQNRPAIAHDWNRIFAEYNEYFGIWGRWRASENYASSVIVNKLLGIVKDNKDGRGEKHRRREELRLLAEKCKKESDEFWKTKDGE